MKKAIRVILMTGLMSGIIMGVILSVIYGASAGLAGGMLAGAACAFVMFIILGPLHIQAVKKIAPCLNSESYGTSHTRTFAIQIPFDVSFDLCEASLKQLNKHKVLINNRDKGQLMVKTGVNWKTWGDTIFFQLEKKDGPKTVIKVSSQPSSSMTIVDYGKNLDNVEKIISYLNNSVIQKPAFKEQNQPPS